MQSNQFKLKKGILYQIENGKIKKYKPWIGDAFSIFYDLIMQKQIFPKKFKADRSLHYEIIRKQYQKLHSKNILELATGSGDVASIIPHDNFYTGIDISASLLAIAKNRFKKANLKKCSLYLIGVENLFFEAESFDCIICNLSFNFFPNTINVIKTISKILKNNGSMICSVPVMNRIPEKSKIRGTLFADFQWKEMLEKCGLKCYPIPVKNGAVFYFTAYKNS